MRRHSTPGRGARRLGAPLVAAALGACIQYEDVDLGHDLDGGFAGVVSLDAGTSSGGDAGPPFVSAAIGTKKGTVCRGECTELMATATGGAGPFTYTWGQGLGSGAGPKSVCPTATTTYSVIVGTATSEEQSAASATVTVVACDAGSAAGTDAGHGAAAPAMSLCVSNPSFEGATMIGTSGPPGVQPTAAPPQWQVCLGSPDIDPTVSLLPASDGSSYVGLAVGSTGLSSLTEAVGTTLCAPARVGVAYPFCIDLGVAVRGLMNVPGVVPPVLQFWGGSSPCSQDELLWTSPPITNVDSWKTVCGSFVPSQAVQDLVVVPAQGGSPGPVTGTMAPASWSYVIVDHLVAGP